MSVSSLLAGYCDQLRDGPEMDGRATKTPFVDAPESQASWTLGRSSLLVAETEHDIYEIRRHVMIAEKLTHRLLVDVEG
jgi:hypothetical protein